MIKKDGGETERENAYLTVEAALVLPMFIGMILFIIYMLLFQYDRCLMEQDLGAMALWGGSAEESDTKTLEEMARERMSAFYRDKYCAWRFTDLELLLKKNHFTAKGSGQLAFPVPGLNYWSNSNIWSTEALYEYRRLSPVTFIRLCRGLINLVQGDS